VKEFEKVRNQILDWGVERIIMSHGAIIQDNLAIETIKQATDKVIEKTAERSGITTSVLTMMSKLQK